MNPFFKVVILATAVLLCAGAAFGLDDRIAVYADESASSCNLVDVESDVHQLFVIFTGTSDIGAVEFQLMPTNGAELTFLAQAIPDFAAGAMGNADTRVAIALDGCYNGTVTLLKVIYEGLGVSGVCSRLSILPNPVATVANGDKIRFITCDSQNAWADPGHLTVNPDDNCACEVDPDHEQTPVAENTWGGIKAMYAD
jgi:hypothetical protein